MARSTNMAPRSTTNRAVRDRIRLWLIFYRATRGWTNRRLAAELGISEPTLANIVNGKRDAGLDVLVRMHHRLFRSADDFIDTEPKPLPRNHRTKG